MFVLYKDYKRTNVLKLKHVALNILMVVLDLVVEIIAFNLGVPQIIIAIAASINALALNVLGYFLEGQRFSIWAAIAVILSCVVFTAVAPQVSVVNPHDPRIENVITIGCTFLYLQHEYAWRPRYWTTLHKTMAFCSGATAGFTATLIKSSSESIAQGNWDRSPIYVFGVIVFGINQGVVLNMMLKYGLPYKDMPLYMATYIVCVSFGGILAFGEIVTMSTTDLMMYVAAMICVCVGSVFLSQSATPYLSIEAAAEAVVTAAVVATGTLSQNDSSVSSASASAAASAASPPSAPAPASDKEEDEDV